MKAGKWVINGLFTQIMPVVEIIYDKLHGLASMLDQFLTSQIIAKVS